jgi:valine--pyruvate aminotransferase
MKLSAFGEKFTARTGILDLMDDLGAAMARPSKELHMLGGGNPASVPAIEKVLRARMEELLKSPKAFDRMLGVYDAPKGKVELINALVTEFNNLYGWGLTPANIALTNGSQSAFFCLFNMFGGLSSKGELRKILLPLTPEYIGYADQGITPGMFTAGKPRIARLDRHRFKYFVNFEELKVGPDIAAICASRPTNPTGNVLTDAEVQHLSEIAKERDIPLFIDNAYGAPFPNIIFEEVNPIWDQHIVLGLTLSKVGLPAARTGIVIANEEIIRAISSMTAIMSLASGGIGASLVHTLVSSGELVRLCREEVRAFYETRARDAIAHVHDCFDDGLDYYVHKCEGSMFLWLWFNDLPITTAQLYERLKARGVLVIPGHHFFPGYQDEWRHKHQCIRVNYALDTKSVNIGIKIIAEEVARAYRED